MREAGHRLPDDRPANFLPRNVERDAYDPPPVPAAPAMYRRQPSAASAVFGSTHAGIGCRQGRNARGQ